jgi:hypothetical protein
VTDACFTATGRVLLSAYSGRAVPYSDAKAIWLSDVAGRQLTVVGVRGALDPLWATSACQGGRTTGDMPVYVVAGDPPRVYAAGATTIDGTPLTAG